MANLVEATQSLETRQAVEYTANILSKWRSMNTPIVLPIQSVEDKNAINLPHYTIDVNPEIESEETMISFTNEDIIAQRLVRDKAIIAMHLLRVTKPKGDKGKGIGPNREDHPLFREVVHMWLNKTPIAAEELVKIEEARARVVKYGKQLNASIYAGPIMQNEFKRHEMMESVNHTYKKQADAELAEAIKEQTYGGW